MNPRSQNSILSKTKVYKQPKRQGGENKGLIRTNRIGVRSKWKEVTN